MKIKKKKKQFNFRNNKGFVGIDTSIAIIILLIVIPTLTAMIYNVNKENNSIKRKSQSLNFATNTMEIAKGMDYDTLTIDNLETEIANYYASEGTITNSDTSDGKLIINKDSINYNLELNIKDYNEVDNSYPSGDLKYVTVNVYYILGGKQQNIELSERVG